jgi:glyoxylase-like metal-dependent hydrolase (beta-lactamase superfamily II)
MEVWQIGDVRVTRVVDLVMQVSPRFIFPDATPENLAPMKHWLAPHFLDEEGRVPLSIHTFVIEAGGRRLLADTCLGNDKPRPFPEWNLREGTFLSDLEKAGFSAGSIDGVLCTHLHVDHVGWNTMLQDGAWVPTFPNARYLIADREWDFWKTDTDALGTAVLGDSVQPIFDADRAELVNAEYEVSGEVRLVPTPGHTPGHVSIEISSRGEEAIITGDLIHHPLQCARPDWKDNFDVSREMARETRTKFLERYEDKPALILGTHIGAPTAGRIARDGDAWRFEV